MEFSILRICTALLALTLSIGCATHAPDEVMLEAKSTLNSPPDSVANLIGSAPVSGVVNLPLKNPLGLDAVVIDSDYHAASGRLCRRMSSLNGQTISRVLCQFSSTRWQFSRDLATLDNVTTTPTSAALVQRMSSTDSVSTAPIIVNASFREPTHGFEETNSDNVNATSPVEVVDQHRVLDSETLWSFSKRITGHAKHWKRIAEMNSIVNARLVKAGMMLSVPNDLLLVDQ